MFRKSEFPVVGSWERLDMTTSTLASELRLDVPRPIRKRHRLRYRVGATALALGLTLGGCDVDDTDPTDVTEDEGLTGSTGLVEPDNGGSAPTTLGGGSTSSTSPGGAGTSTTGGG